MTGKGSLEAEAVSIIRLLITAEMMQWLTSHKLCKHRVVMKETNMALMALALFMEGFSNFEINNFLSFHHSLSIMF